MTHKDDLWGVALTLDEDKSWLDDMLHGYATYAEARDAAAKKWKLEEGESYTFFILKEVVSVKEVKAAKKPTQYHVIYEVSFTDGSKAVQNAIMEGEKELTNWITILQGVKNARILHVIKGEEISLKLAQNKGFGT